MIIRLFVRSQLDSIVDACWKTTVTKAEIQAEKADVDLNAKSSETRGADRSCDDGDTGSGTVAMDNDEFAVGEITEMSFGGGSFSGNLGKPSAANNGSIKLAPLSPNSQAKRRQRLATLFDSYDSGRGGSLAANKFKTMCLDVLAKAKSVPDAAVKQFNTANDVDIVVAALDMDGDGAVQKDEFVSWIASGLQRSANDRQKFAKKNKLNARLEMFLSAVEEQLQDDFANF